MAFVSDPNRLSSVSSIQHESERKLRALVADGRERRVIAETVGGQRAQGLHATEVLGGQQLGCAG